jgi:hypothetical protein
VDRLSTELPQDVGFLQLQRFRQAAGERIALLVSLFEPCQQSLDMAPERSISPD